MCPCDYDVLVTSVPFTNRNKENKQAFPIITSTSTGYTFSAPQTKFPKRLLYIANDKNISLQREHQTYRKET